MIAILLALMSMMQPDSIAVRTIDKGLTSNNDTARQVVARTEAELGAIWKAHDPNRPMPKVDFSKEMVVAVFLGSRPTAGYAVAIVGAELRNGVLVVRYREMKPAPGAITAQVLTSPYHIAAVQQHAGDVRFEKA